MDVFTHRGKTYLKLAGRTKTTFKYYCGVVSTQDNTVQVSISFEQQFGPLFNLSMHSFSWNIIIYQPYTCKSKPVLLSFIEFIENHDSEPTVLATKVEVAHLQKQLTIVEVYSLSKELVCLIGCDSYEDVRTSFMILYSVMEREVRNYLTFDRTVLGCMRLFWDKRRGNEGYEWKTGKNSVSMDAFEWVEKEGSTRCFQLTPESYLQKEDCRIPGKVVFTD